MIAKELALLLIEVSAPNSEQMKPPQNACSVKIIDKGGFQTICDVPMQGRQGVVASFEVNSLVQGLHDPLIWSDLLLFELMN